MVKSKIEWQNDYRIGLIVKILQEVIVKQHGREGAKESSSQKLHHTLGLGMHGDPAMADRLEMKGGHALKTIGDWMKIFQLNKKPCQTADRAEPH